MSRIESKIGLLKSIDDEAKVLGIILDDNVTVIHRFSETSTPNITYYPYAVNLEWKDPNILNKLGKRVEIQLVD